MPTARVENPEIVVVGAGVIGLQTALSLCEAGYRVMIVAKYWPGDISLEYTSPWAGAHWRSHAGPNDKKLQEFERQTFEYWKELVEKEGVERTGLAFTPIISYWDLDSSIESEDPTNLWWTTFIPNLQILPTASLPPGTSSGLTYTSICINPTVYLPYLLQKLLATYNIQTSTQTLHSLDELFKQYPTILGIVNCTGLGSKFLVREEEDSIYPVKGQTILVKNNAPCVKIRLGKDHITYIIPRPAGGGSILGGSNDINDWSEEVDENLSRDIVQRCKELAPEMGEIELVGEYVGRRPGRRGGPRVELEWAVTDGVRRFICHEYGHGGAGYQSSVGSAREVVRLINEGLKRSL